MHHWLKNLGLAQNNPGVFSREWKGGGKVVERLSPVDGKPIASIYLATRQDYEWAASNALEAFTAWRMTPAPVRGETIRQLGNALRDAKTDLSRLVTLESGKILAESEGEVQEMIDVCDFAVGLSRQLYGLTIQSERPKHRLMEQWHPLGPVGVITAFNFPVAVWSWNAAIASVCGNAVIWKPSEKTPLTAIAVTHIAERVCHNTHADPALFSLVVGDLNSVGKPMVADPRLPLISATGSCAMGVKVAEVVHKRLGRSLLELGGNNAAIVTPSADLDLATRAIFFGAIGTAGQRCTSTRRVFVHKSIERPLRQRLIAAYSSVRIGNPLHPDTLMGPLIDHAAVRTLLNALERLPKQGGQILYGGETLTGKNYPGGCYVTPCLATADPSSELVQEETFAPLLYIMSYETFDQAIELQNAVPQGLSSSVFTQNFSEAEQFMCAAGSDCGIANVNTGTSGAEIGGAFGGEKATGGGRESGSDAWKNYMRRQTNTVNYSRELPLSQGIKFGDQMKTLTPESDLNE